MVILHQSRLLKDRNPYGAAQTGTVIEFSVRHIPEEGDDAVRVLTLGLCIRYQCFQAQLQPYAQGSGCTGRRTGPLHRFCCHAVRTMSFFLLV